MSWSPSSKQRNKLAPAANRNTAGVAAPLAPAPLEFLSSMSAIATEERRRNFCIEDPASAMSADHARFSAGPAWDTRHRCSPQYRFDAGSLQCYSMCLGRNSASQSRIIWAKKLVQPRSENLAKLENQFRAEFGLDLWGKWSARLSGLTCATCML